METMEDNSVLLRMSQISRKQQQENGLLQFFFVRPGCGKTSWQARMFSGKNIEAKMCVRCEKVKCEEKLNDK